MRNILFIERRYPSVECCALKKVCDVSIEVFFGDFVHSTAGALKTTVPRRERLTETNSLLELTSGNLSESKNAPPRQVLD